jgi:hypothetical protein
MANRITVGNYFTTTLAQPLGIADTIASLVAQPSTAGLPAVILANTPLIVTLTDGNFYEIVEMSIPSPGGTAQLVRATEGTAARAWAAGTEASLRITAEVLRHAAAGSIDSTLLKDPAYLFQPRISKHVIPVDNLGVAQAQIDVGEYQGAYVAKSVSAYVVAAQSTPAIATIATIDAPTITVATVNGTALASLPAVLGAVALQPNQLMPDLLGTGLYPVVPNALFAYPTIQNLDILANALGTDSPVLTISANPVLKDVGGVTLAANTNVVVLVEFVPIQ